MDIMRLAEKLMDETGSDRGWLEGDFVVTELDGSKTVVSSRPVRFNFQKARPGAEHR